MNYIKRKEKYLDNKKLQKILLKVTRKNFQIKNNFRKKLKKKKINKKSKPKK